MQAAFFPGCTTFSWGIFLQEALLPGGICPVHRDKGHILGKVSID